MVFSKSSNTVIIINMSSTVERSSWRHYSQTRCTIESITIQQRDDVIFSADDVTRVLMVTSLVYAGFRHQFSNRLLELVETAPSLVYSIEYFSGRRLELVLKLLQQLLHMLREVGRRLGVDGRRRAAIIGGRWRHCHVVGRAWTYIRHHVYSSEIRSQCNWRPIELRPPVAITRYWDCYCLTAPLSILVSDL